MPLTDWLRSAPLAAAFACGLCGALAVPVARADDAAPTRPEPAPTREEIDAAIRKGLDFLLSSQNPNGSWGSATETTGEDVYAPVPGAHHAFRAATTALCICTLIETADPRQEAHDALLHGEDWLLENLPHVRRATGDAIYNVWAHIYSIQALVKMSQQPDADEARQARIRKLIELQFDLLTRYESVDGGWGYYDFRYEARHPTSDSISFVNAAGLVALYEARQAGFEPPRKLVDRAIAATLRQRLGDFSYLYGEYLHWQPRRGINRPGGSLGRTQACNFALRLWGDEKVTDSIMEEWLTRLVTRNGWLVIGRKRPIPHESWFQVAGYFYYFGHYYAARCIEALPSDQRAQHQAPIARIILDRQEKDGSWWDFPLYAYHRPYGTSFAVMTLLRCR